MADLTQRLKF